MKSKGVAYRLLIFFGTLGLHRFYIGKIGTGFLYLRTGGLFVVGVLVDLFTLGTQVGLANIKERGTGRLQGQNQSHDIVVNVNTPPPPATSQVQDTVPEVTKIAETSKSMTALPEVSAEKQILAITTEFPIISMKDVLMKTSPELDEATTSMARLVSGGVAKEIDVGGDKQYDFR